MKYILIIAAVSFVLFSACSSQNENEESGKVEAPKSMLGAESDPLHKEASVYFQSIEAAKGFESPLAVLGKKLYYETALSINDELSCNSCHMLDKYGVDNEATSPGHEGKRGDRNSPTVYNSSLHFTQFWDGRAADLTEQAKGPILNPIEMGLVYEQDAVSKIKGIEEYGPLFSAAFPEIEDPINYQNIAEAIAGFEECLITPSRWDDFLNGDIKALSKLERNGLRLFIDNECTTCHIGPALGGNMYQKFGLKNGPYWDYTGSELHDEGRFSVTGKEHEKYFFKVPSLRNIEKTGPYFHDGSVASLEKAVTIMAKTQSDKDLEAEELVALIAFMKALTGEIPKEALN